MAKALQIVHDVVVDGIAIRPNNPVRMRPDNHRMASEKLIFVHTATINYKLMDEKGKPLGGDSEDIALGETDALLDLPEIIGLFEDAAVREEIETAIVKLESEKAGKTRPGWDFSGDIPKRAAVEKSE